MSEGGSTASRGATAVYALADGAWASCIPGAPEFVHTRFRDLVPDRLPMAAPLVATTSGVRVRG